MSESMESFSPLTISPIIPPVKASGIVNITMKGERRLWNWATITR